MPAKAFALKFPQKTAWVMGQGTEPDSPVRVGCVVAIAVTEGVPLDRAKVDQTCEAILKTFFEDGMRTVAIENAEGPLTESDILGPRSNALLKARKIRLVGVDRMADIAEMRAIQTEATQRASHFEALFRTVETYFAAVALKLPAGVFTDLFKLRLAKDDASSINAAEIAQIFALERRFGRSMPADARRLLRGIELMGELDGKDLAGELDELKRRMRERVESGVLAEDADVRLPNPEAKPGKPLRLQTGTGMVALNAVQADLLRRCAELVDGVEKGMLPMSLYQMMVRQNQRRAAVGGSATEQFMNDAVDRNQLIQIFIADTAQVLGIDLDDYPTLRRVLQQAHMLAGIAQEGVLESCRQAFDKAWSHLESCVAPHDQGLLASIRKARQLRRLAGLEITPEEYGELSAELPEYRLGDVLAEVAAAGVSIDAKVKVAAMEFDKVRGRLLAFYDRARQRARQMAARTIDFAREDGGQALLICLGFHRSTVQSTWKAERITHLVVVPDMTGDLNSKPKVK